MLDIKLNKDYWVKSDNHNIILYQKKDKSKTPKHLLKKKKEKEQTDGNLEEKLVVGKDTWGVVGYFSNLAYLYEELVDRHVYFVEAKTLEEVLCAINSLKASLIKAK